MVLRVVQEVVREQEWAVIPTQDIIQGQEEEQQVLMGQEEQHQQEEHPRREEVIQDLMPTAAPPHNNQEEQAVQAVPHLINLQVYLHLDDILIHGLHWTDLGKPYRSSPCLLTTRVAAYWTCNSF